ncbi:S8 family peptidase [Patescibacteria group bacterium]|nr:S8 family peptidase [Patescibacteria group bacterium]
MKKLTILLLGIFVVIASVVVLWTKNQVSAEGKNEFVKGEVLVRFKEGVTSNEAGRVHKRIGGQVKEVIPGINVQVVAVKRGVGEAVSAYAREGLVEYAEPNYIAYALEDPSDEYFIKQWGLDNDGQEYKDGEFGSVDADIDAPEAWDVTLGSLGIKIAVLDTGIDQNHPDLDNKLIDNINFTTTTSNTVDDLYGHGTHVAGIAAAETNNVQGVAGVGYNSSLLNVKVLDDNASGYYSWIANGMIWAANNGAKVINMSLGAGRKSATLEDAVNYAWSRDVVLVAAAGNSNNPSRTYPAYYENVIAVAATDSNDAKASFSSYGSWVDVAAPGVNIYSTFPNHPYSIKKSLNYDFGSGTSMSTPHVAGIAALVWARESGLSNQEVRNRIEQTADMIPGTGSYWIWGRVNACNAVGGNCSGVVPTPTPTPTPEPSPKPSPTPQPDACYNYCLKRVCDNVCHPVKDLPGCPDCL